MGRRTAPTEDDPGSPRVTVTLPPGARALLNKLVEEGIYGSDTAQIARFLLIQKLDELVKEGRMKPPTV
jgi:hypothetical protein